MIGKYSKCNQFYFETSTTIKAPIGNCFNSHSECEGIYWKRILPINLALALDLKAFQI